MVFEETEKLEVSKNVFPLPVQTEQTIADRKVSPVVWGRDVHISLQSELNLVDNIKNHTCM